MNRIMNAVTSMVGRASAILFVQNPSGTAFGAFLGLALAGLLHFVSPALAKLRSWIDPEGVSPFYWIAIGVAIMNIPHMRRHQLPKEVEDAFEVLRRMKKVGISNVQIKVQTLALCARVIERVQIDPQKDRQRQGGQGERTART